MSFLGGLHWYNNLRLQHKSVPLAITPFIEEFGDTYTAGEFELTIADFIVPISIMWSPSSSDIANALPCVLTNEYQKDLMISNSLLAGGYYAWVKSPTLIAVHPIATAASIANVFYIEQPTADIASGVEPQLRDIAHDAIIERALWILLEDRESQQAQAHLQLYGTIMQGLMQ